jgi:outer membrane biogenesis lipoprotein LolB
MRIPIILAVVALALAGCNANQAVNPSSQRASQVWAGHYEDTNTYDPTSYAQNQTGRGGGR